MTRGVEAADALAERWESWCGPTKWSAELRRFGRAGGRVVDWGGVPQSKSSIGLTFELVAPDDSRLPCQYRLRDITAAANTLERWHPLKAAATDEIPGNHARG